MSESTIWTEKYRPQNFSEVRGQQEIIKRVKAFVKQENMPHLLFSGPAGVGKTTLSLVIAKQLFGDSWKNNFLELNASDERGIDVIRTKVKNFARMKALAEVPFKIIYLDECDALTKEAQQALRRTMENFTKTTRFILSCNYASKIIDPIQSRCAVFRFRPVPEKELLKIIDEISKEEKLFITEDAKKAVITLSGGDCRKLENLLQSSAAISAKITEEVVFSLGSFVKPKEIFDILSIAIKGDFVKARDKLLDSMFEYGFSGVDVIKQIQKEVWSLKLDKKKKLDLIESCGETEFRLVEGSDEFLQLESLLAKFVLLGSE